MKRYFNLAMMAISAVLLLISYSCKNNNKTMNAEKKTPAFDVTTMDPTVKPCDDFDTYVNGNWKKHTPDPVNRRNLGLIRNSR